MQTATNNPHLRAARAAKVELLVAAIDAIACDREIDPVRNAAHVARQVVDCLDELGWAELAEEAGCKHPPSADTIKAVRRVYELRELQATDEWFEGLRSVEDLS